MAPAQTLRVEVQAPKPVYVHFLMTSCACRVGQPLIYDRFLYFIFKSSAGVEPLALFSHQYGYALGFVAWICLDFDYLGPLACSTYRPSCSWRSEGVVMVTVYVWCAWWLITFRNGISQGRCVRYVKVVFCVSRFSLFCGILSFFLVTLSINITL